MLRPMLHPKNKALLTLVATFLLTCMSNVFATEVSGAAAHERKSYSNDRFGFAFDYPAAWSLTEKQGQASGEAMLTVKLLSADEDVPVRRDYSLGSVSIEVFANPRRQPVREWLDEHGWPFGPADRSATPITIGGMPGLEVATGKMFAPNRFIFVGIEDRVLRVSALAPESDAVVRSIRFHR